MSPLFPQNLCFFLNLIFFGFPYFDHDAFMHHVLHVLDAPGQVILIGWIQSLKKGPL